MKRLLTTIIILFALILPSQVSAVTFTEWFSNLDQNAAVEREDWLCILDDPSGTPATRYITVDQLFGSGDLTSFVNQTAWRVFYSNTDGDVTELALGADGTYLKSNGPTSAPTFTTPSGSGDVVGPASATDGNVTLFDGATGKLIKDSGLALSGSNTGDQTISDATISITDITTNNVSSSKHGFAPKGDGTTTKFLNANGAYSTPSGGGNVSTSGTPVDNDFAKFVSATEIEGRSYSEVRTDLNVADGADVTADNAPKAHTASHTDGTDDIQSATNAQKGLATAAHITAIEANTSKVSTYTNLTSFVSQTPWRVFYSNTDGDVTELALGADGTFLKSNGAAAAPTFTSPAGGGDVSGPATNTDEYIPQWNGADSKTLKNGFAKSTLALSGANSDITSMTGLNDDGIPGAKVVAASTTTEGVAELAIASEVNTGTSTTLAVTPDSLAGSIHGEKTLYVKVIANDTALATGDGKAYVTIPDALNGMNLVDVDCCVYTVSSSGTPTFQVHNLTDTTDMSSTLITIDATEFSSYTAATPPVINTAADDVATGDRLRLDCDVAGTGTKGWDFILVFQTP